MSEQVRRRVVVRGRVQGVFFRDTCRREAARRGVAGWVPNRRDGAVEAVFEGAPGARERAGGVVLPRPARRRVDGRRTVDEEPEGLSGFEVR